MSFADTVRENLLSVPVRKNCCRRSFLCGLFVAAVPSPDNHSDLACRFRTEAIAQTAAEQLRIQFSKEPVLRRIGFCGKYYEEVSVESRSFRKLIDGMQGGTDEKLPELLGFRCEECRSAFLRGLFLSCGTVNDPHKPVHLEFSVPARAKNGLHGFFEEIGYPAKTVTRGGNIGFYFKESTAVEDLLAMAGAHRVIFDVINTRIEREIRNHENRVNNCDTRNIERMVSATARQMEAIEKLRETGRILNLPEQLRTTAELRYQNPDYSLDELAEIHRPPITKSGLNHRLRKIVEAAEDL